MALFSRKKKPGADQRELLERLDGRELQTVTRRDPETSAETVIGKAGRINTLHGQIVIVCDGREVFRCGAATARCGRADEPQRRRHPRPGGKRAGNHRGGVLSVLP